MWVHNEIRDAVGDLASLVRKDVLRKPVIREYNPAMIAEGDTRNNCRFFCRGVYVRQGGASFDIRVAEPTPSPIRTEAP